MREDLEKATPDTSVLADTIESQLDSAVQNDTNTKALAEQTFTLSSKCLKHEFCYLSRSMENSQSSCQVNSELNGTVPPQIYSPRTDARDIVMTSTSHTQGISLTPSFATNMPPYQHWSHTSTDSDQRGCGVTQYPLDTDPSIVTTKPGNLVKLTDFSEMDFDSMEELINYEQDWF